MGGEAIVVIIFVVLLVVAVAYISTPKSSGNKEDEPKKATANLLAEGLDNLNLGNAFLEQGRLDEAITEYQKAIAIDSECHGLKIFVVSGDC